MTKQVQRRRGTATQHTSFTGAEGELSVNTTNKSVHVHDNVTAGGFEAARVDMDNVTSSSILTAAGITATTTELNYVDGVTSAIQTQIDGKAGTASPTFTGTLTTANLTATGTVTADSLTMETDNASIVFTGTTGNNFITAKQGLRIDIDSDNNQGATSFGVTRNGGLGNVLNANENGDVTLYASDGTTAKFFWDASTENLGIGTSTPRTGLHLYGAGQTNSAISDAGSLGAFLRVSDTGAAGGAGGGVIFGTNASEADGFAGFAAIKGLLSNGNDRTIGALAFSTRAATTDTALTERMRLTSDGNLLVGKTATSTADQGIQINPSGRIDSTSNGAEALRLNRKTSDGDILQFRKDNSTVGSIGAGSGRIAVGNGNTFVTFAGDLNALYPASSSSTTPRDNAVDIGTSGTRFKDLHLSGTGYVGTSLGIGTSSPDQNLTIGAGGKVRLYRGDNTRYGDIYTDNNFLNIETSNDPIKIGGPSYIRFDTNSTERMRIDSSGNLLVGSTNTDGFDGTAGLKVANSTAGFLLEKTGTRSWLQYISSDGSWRLYDSTDNAERMLVDSSGNLLVGTTNASLGTGGIQLNASGRIGAAASSLSPMVLNRQTSDGTIIDLRKNGTTVGSIGTLTGQTYIGGSSASGLYFGGSRIQPMSNGSLADNLIDMGHPSYRFDDIYATNGTINTSDRNEKQDIAELSEAEQRVAVAAKGLLRKFRWKDAVAEKGDEARTHFGIIAQDLQAAFAAEGLDAGDYAMFISSTWTDEETGEERTRMGVRYSELLAFIIAAI